MHTTSATGWARHSKLFLQAGAKQDCHQHSSIPGKASSSPTRIPALDASGTQGQTQTEPTPPVTARGLPLRCQTFLPRRLSLHCAPSLPRRPLSLVTGLPGWALIILPSHRSQGQVQSIPAKGRALFPHHNTPLLPEDHTLPPNLPPPITQRNLSI